MSDHILFREENEFNSLDTLQNILRFDQSGSFLSRQIDLGDITGYDRFGVETDPCLFAAANSSVAK